MILGLRGMGFTKTKSYYKEVSGTTPTFKLGVFLD